MGVLDDLKAKAQNLARQRGDQIKGGLDKAAKLADAKTGRKHSGKLEKGVQKAKGFVDKLGEEPEPARPAPPPPGAQAPDPGPPPPPPPPGADPGPGA
ncbi:MAG TPA: antitoxin [Acidimicrobiia bacterium]|nr:antitoxin [Acidimicrobiia bacterium]